MRHFDASKLLILMQSELAELDVAADSIRHVTGSLVQTSLRGVDSHGINLFPHYCRAVAAGRINARPNMVCTVSGASTAVIDADHAFGHHAGAYAMAQAVMLARESGMAAINVQNSTHFGAAAYFGMLAAEKDCLGFAFTNADALVKAFGSTDTFFGTNPICFTAPMEHEGPFCLDMATSLVSWNKINNYRRENKEIPPDWAFDAKGKRVTDPHSACSLNPAGGYKGFGLGMMIDILCATLCSGIVSKDLKAMYEPPLDDSKRSISHFFMVLDIARFCDPCLFRHNLQVMADRVRALPRMEGEENVMVAGDPEKLSFLRRSKEGIPVDDSKYAEFIEINPAFSEVLAS